MSLRPTPESLAIRLAGHAGLTIADARHGRMWTLRELADRSGLAPSAIHAVEHGRPAGLETYSALAIALDLDLRLDLVDPRRRARSVRAEDPVHAAMGEAIAARISSHGFPIAIDEPFQHYQFAGRADVLAWDLPSRSLLHVENRTRFPNVQEAFGSYNAKRRYLPDVMAERLGIKSGFATVSNVVVALWSTEVLHAVRLHPASFRAVCPADIRAFEAWWSGEPPAAGPSTSAFVLFDPIPQGASMRRRFIGLEQALDASSRPRYRGYADAVERLRSAG
jgi:transcriptional regulator with XRE-family HTH domain